MGAKRLAARAAVGLAVAAAAGAAAWGALSARDRAALDHARGAMARGAFGEAAAGLAAHPPRWSGRDEGAYLLGVCEARAGRPDAAMAAWRRVPPGSPFAEDAALRAGVLAAGRGRYAEAEAVLTAALTRPGPAAVSLRYQLQMLLWHQGRVDDAARLIEENWRALAAGRPREAFEFLRAHQALDLNPYPAEGVAARLDGAAALAPDDDRVWLGRAHLATLAGRYDEARRWLDACRDRRPDDPVVWRARLDWALAAGRVDEAHEAARRLPAGRFPPARAAALRAWVAARRGDPRAEREALRSEVDRDPGAAAAWARLAELTQREGRADEAARLRARKAELDDALDRYRRLFGEGSPDSRALEQGRLAAALGRRFEARAFLSTALRRGTSPRETAEALARLGPDEPTPPDGSTLAAVAFAGLAPQPVRASPPPGPEAPPLRFRDDSRASGLAAFTYQTGATPYRQLPEVMGGGVGLLDYDGDGRLDLYAVQGGPFPPDPDRPPPGDRLFRNKGDGTFEDVTARAGLSAFPRGYGMGVAVGDYDNDGHTDLFVTRWRSYALYRNRGDGSFEDATEVAGFGGDRDWPTSAAWADLDGDGDLDLYVCHYLKWDAGDPRLCRSAATNDYASCPPLEFEALADHVFRNDGGRFVDVSAAAGVVDTQGRGLGVVADDLDGDGRVDLFVANDGSANFLFRNLGGFRFEEVGHEAGVSGNAGGGYQAGMGVACGDLDGDGRPDLAVTNFYGESTTFFANLGGGQFADRTAAVGLAAPSRSRLGFGAAFLDADNDGRLDLLTANGHVNDYRPESPYAMPMLLMRGTGGGRLADATDGAGPALNAPRLGRGLAAGDLDNDGRTDAVVVARDEPLLALRNRTEGGHFVTIGLRGVASNRDGVGASVSLTAGGRRRVARRSGGGSYLSAGDPRLSFGLGGADRAEAVEVRWPSGRVDRFPSLAAGRGYLLREGAPAPEPLPGFGP